MQLKKRILRFLCQECNSGLLQIPSIIQSIRELKTEINLLKSTKTNESSVPTPSPIINMNEIIAEMNERELRKKNIMIFGLPEDLNNTQADRGTALEILKSAYPNAPDNFKLFRVGQVSANNTKPRPLKIILTSPEESIQILRNVKEIRSKQKFSNLVITSDKTPNQTLQYKRLKEELITRTNNGETNLKIKYFNGEPKIIKN